MTNIKDLINKIKTVAKVSSNIELANYFNISYNTLNTWIKRGKIPQDILLDFCIKNNCSLDYLLLEKQTNNLFEYNDTNSDTNSYSFTYYGKVKELNIEQKAKLILDKNLLHNNGYYLTYLNTIYFIVNVEFDLFNITALLKYKDKFKKLTIKEFKDINLGLITNIQPL